MWLQKQMPQIEVYTPEDQWLCALRLTTMSGRHYQLEVYLMEQVAPCPEITSDIFTLGRLEHGVTLYQSSAAGVAQHQRDHDRNATPAWGRVGLLFDQTHHVVAWGDLDREGDFYHLVEKLNQFVKYTHLVSTTAS